MQTTNAVLARTAVAVALAFAAIALAALPARAVDQSVNISGLAFAPASVSVNVGDTVTWTNNDAGIPHTVTADGGAFDSGNMTTGQSFAQTFSAAGTFAYHCNVHPTMTGTVVVAAASGGATTTPSSGSTPAPGATTAPPAVGTGLAPGSDGNGSLPLAILGGGMAVVLGAAASAVLAARRR
ncbi:MAG: cupredoxin family copper-binding protein [Dehalococcoidia bacterium]